MDLEYAANSFGEIASTRDLVAELLAAKRSVNTRRAYEKDLYDFFTTMTEQEPHPALVREFLRLNRFAAVAVVLKYKAKLIDKGLKEATINRRIDKFVCQLYHTFCIFHPAVRLGKRRSKYFVLPGIFCEARRFL